MHLHTLTIINCLNVLDYTPLSSCVALLHLHIAHTMQLCDDDLIAVGHKGRLKTVTIEKCFNVTSESVNHILHRCTLTEVSACELHSRQLWTSSCI